MGMSFDEFLAHYGVKGMKWGVRKEYEPTGRDSANKTTPKSQFKTVELSETEKAVVDKLAPHGYDIDRMDRMFGPKSKGEEPKPERNFRLTPPQKKALLIGGGAVLAGVALYGLNKKGQALLLDQLDPLHSFEGANEHFRSVFGTYVNRSQDREIFGFSKEYVESLDRTPLVLPKGSILKRLSMDQETSIRPGGFFASYKDSDVERYKAILPVFWKMWGGDPDEGGFIVHLRANSEVRAASKRETWDTFVSLLKEPAEPGSTTTVAQALKAVHGQRYLDDDEFARWFFPKAAVMWNDNTVPLTQRMFSALKAKGYNAVFDLNDAGNLADSPLRTFDGSMFSVVKNEVFSPEQIKSAQERVLELVQSVFGGAMSGRLFDTDEFLAHYGVRGMKWGVRRGRKEATSRTRYSKPPSKLTDAELKRRLQRLENEKRYNELNKGDVNAGKDFTAKILKNVGSTTATTLLGAAAIYGGKLAIKRVVGETHYQGMFPKKKK